MSNKTILVAGGGGFIGGHLVAHFRNEGVKNIRSVDIKPTIECLVEMVEDIADMKLEHNHNLSAPKGVNGRNSDNIQELLGWAPGIRLRDGMAKTYDWILGEYNKVHDGAERTVIARPGLEE